MFHKMVIIGIIDDYPKYILRIKNLWQSHRYSICSSAYVFYL